MDNAKIHHSGIVKNFIVQENIRVTYLSPYSYMLNPIEYSFSKIKSVVRDLLSSNYTGDLHSLITLGVSSITKNDIEGYFRLVERNCFDAIELIDF